jgi:hypothetical protein
MQPFKLLFMLIVSDAQFAVKGDQLINSSENLLQLIQMMLWGWYSGYN